MKISKFFSVYPSLLKGVLFKFNPPKVPSLARSVHKPLKVPSLARSVLKPPKEPSLARAVLKPLSIFALRHVQCPSHSQSSLCRWGPASFNRHSLPTSYTPESASEASLVASEK